MRRDAAALAAGLIFGFGLALAGMTNPAKVLGFLDLSGAWDPSLLLVLGGAVLVTFVGYRFVLRRPQPLFDDRFQLPPKAAVDPALVTGAGLFGIGWGIAGYCPGPAIALLAAPGVEAWIFLPALVAGILLQGLTRRQGHGSVTEVRPDRTD
jgi:uncharacterized protein